MTKILLSVIAIFIAALFSHAQSTITYAGNAYATGDVVEIEQGEDALSVSQSGANVTWDLSNLPAGIYNESYDIVDASTAPGNADFPAATHAIYSDLLANYQFISITPSGMEDHGNSAEFLFDFSNPRTSIYYPTTYGSTLTDTYEGILEIGQTFDYEGTSNFTADAWGTLILPNVTYNNVLRVHVVQNETQTFSVMGQEFVTTINNNIYRWFSPAHKGIIFEYTESETIILGTPEPTEYVWSHAVTNPITDSVDEWAKTQTLAAYPNPSQDGIINIEGINESFTYEVYNTMGQRVYQGREQSNKNLNLNSLDSGTYELIIHTQDRVFRSRVVLNK